MKKYVFLFLCISFLMLSCDENMPVIDCLSCENEEGPDLGPQDKRVLIEEFTGVRCINCPGGSVELENLLSQQNGRLIAVSIHAEFFATPYPENQYDFRTPEGEDIINLLGLPEAYPSAVIDRKQFSGESDLQLVGQGSWAGRISEQVAEPAKVSLALENSYNDASRVLNVTVSGQAQEGIDEEVRVTIMLTETGIIDAQLTPESSPDNDLNYVHKHVLRKTLTSSTGDVVAASMVIGATFEESYSFTIPTAWEASECDVIAFVHLSQGNKEVLQATEAHLAD